MRPDFPAVLHPSLPASRLVQAARPALPPSRPVSLRSPLRSRLRSRLLAAALPLALLAGCSTMATGPAGPAGERSGSQPRAAGQGPSIPVVTNREVSDARQAQNLDTVLSFYEAGLNQKDFEAASRHFGPHYIQHNPTAEDGVEGFRKFIAFLKERYPQSRSEVRTAFASGDYVILHVLSRRTPDATGSAIVDIFRLENGKIVEHWDVIQPIPEKAANTNTMF